MRNGLLALVLSLGVHLMIAGALAVALTVAPTASAPAELDLSSVELSLSEKPQERLPPQPLPSASAPAREAAPEPQMRPPDPVLEPLPELPPEMAAVPLPEPPAEEVAVLDLPSADVPAEQPREAPDQARVEASPELKSGFDMKRIYPKESRQRGEQGDVVLEFEVSAKGGVTSVRLVASSGYPALDAAALKAARKARFTPARSGDRAVPSTARLTLSFQLKK